MMNVCWVITAVNKYVTTILGISTHVLAGQDINLKLMEIHVKVTLICKMLKQFTVLNVCDLG